MSNFLIKIFNDLFVNLGLGCVIIDNKRKKFMSLISVVIVLIILGVLLWACNTYLPLDPTVKKIINVVVIVGILLFLCNVIGLFDGLHDVRIPKIAH